MSKHPLLSTVLTALSDVAECRCDGSNTILGVCSPLPPHGRLDQVSFMIMFNDDLLEVSVNMGVWIRNPARDIRTYLSRVNSEEHAGRFIFVQHQIFFNANLCLSDYTKGLPETLQFLLVKVVSHMEMMYQDFHEEVCLEALFPTCQE